MPVVYRIDTKQGVIFTRCVGNVTLSEVLDHFPTLEQDPECPNRLNVLLDLSEMTSIPQPDQLRAVSDQIGRTQDRVRFETCAIVASRDVIFGMSRMFEVFAQKWFREILVFRARDEAEAWLISRLASGSGA